MNISKNTKTERPVIPRLTRNLFLYGGVYEIAGQARNDETPDDKKNPPSRVTQMAKPCITREDSLQHFVLPTSVHNTGGLHTHHRKSESIFFAVGFYLRQSLT